MTRPMKRWMALNLGTALLLVPGCAVGNSEVAPDVQVEDSCLQTGCPANFLCNVSTGLCEPWTPPGIDGGHEDGSVNPTPDGALGSDALVGWDASSPDAQTVPDAQTQVDSGSGADGGGCVNTQVVEIEPNNGYLDVLNNDLGVLDCDLELIGQASFLLDSADGFRVHVTVSRSVTFSLTHVANGADLDLGLYRVTAGLDGIYGTLDDVVTQVAFSGTPPPQTTEEFTVILNPGAPYDVVVHAMAGTASYTIDVSLQ